MGVDLILRSGGEMMSKASGACDVSFGRFLIAWVLMSIQFRTCRQACLRTVSMHEVEGMYVCT